MLSPGNPGATARPIIPGANDYFLKSVIFALALSLKTVVGSGSATRPGPPGPAPPVTGPPSPGGALDLPLRHGRLQLDEQPLPGRPDSPATFPELPSDRVDQQADLLNRIGSATMIVHGGPVRRAMA